MPSSSLSASRVHSTTPFGSGSPEATPSLNGLSDNRGAAATLPVIGAVRPAAASTKAL
jgi:hypothetical protein